MSVRKRLEMNSPGGTVRVSVDEAALMQAIGRCPTPEGCGPHGCHGACLPAAKLTEDDIEFALNNQMEDPSDDESAGFYAGARWAEAKLKLKAAAHGIGSVSTSEPAPQAEAVQAQALEVLDDLKQLASEAGDHTHESFSRAVIRLANRVHSIDRARTLASASDAAQTGGAT